MSRMHDARRLVPRSLTLIQPRSEATTLRLCIHCHSGIDQESEMNVGRSEWMMIDVTEGGLHEDFLSYACDGELDFIDRL